MKKEYRIDWQTNTFTITKKFAAEANHYGTEAYNMLMDARAKGFNLVVSKEKKPRKVCPTRITFKQMEIILSCMDYADERLAQLHAVMDAGKGQAAAAGAAVCKRPCSAGAPAHPGRPRYRI